MEPTASRFRHILAIAFACAASLRPAAAQAQVLPSWFSTNPVFLLEPQEPPLLCGVPGANELAWGLSAVYSNDFAHGPVYDAFGVLLYREVYIDYESVGAHLDLEYGLGNGHAVGIELGATWYYGGLFDPFLQAYHGFFGFPNNMREAFPDNRLLFDLPLEQGLAIGATEARLALDAPLAWYAWQFFDERDIALCARFGLSGPLPGDSFLPDRGVHAFSALYADFRIDPGFRVWMNLGLSYGFAGAPGFSARLGTSIAILDGTLLVVQMVFRTSPAAGMLPPEPKYAQLAEPDADLFVGFFWRLPGEGGELESLSLSMQQDPISHNTADVSLILNASGTF